MSRSGYVYDCENAELYRHAVERSIHGKRGQAFLRELAKELDAMEEKVLISDALVDHSTGEACALGVVFLSRGIDPLDVDWECPDQVGGALGIARSLAAEIEYMNDEWFCAINGDVESPEDRWKRMRRWVEDQIDG